MDQEQPNSDRLSNTRKPGRRARRASYSGLHAKGIVTPVTQTPIQEVSKFALIQAKKAHQGPLPTPEDLAHYDAIIENGAERIMRMAERNQEHRIYCERKMVNTASYLSRVGQLLAFVLALILIGTAIWCLCNGHVTTATTIFAGTLGTLAIAFLKPRIVGNRKAEESGDKKNSKLDNPHNL